MAAQTLSLDIKGLHTYSSPLSGVPRGAMTIARNLNISRLNIAEPRRGFSFLDETLPLTGDRAKKFVFYDEKFFIHYGTTFGLYDPSGILSRGTLSTPPNAQSIRTKSMNEALYITSSTGLKKMDDTGAAIYQAGIPAGLMIEQDGALVTSGSAITEDYGTVAYRYIIVRKDAKKNTYRGGVSSRCIIFNNSTDDVDVPLKVWLPAGLDVSYYVQVYRSKSFPGSSGVPGSPNDELQFCYEKPLDLTAISNGYFTFTDIRPDDMLEASLYTSPSQGQGMLDNNELPPVARDIEEYKGSLFFADTVNKHRYTFTLIATAGTGLVANDTVTISNGTTTEVYTAKAATNVANKEFAIDVASASIALRIDNTARSLVKVINQGSSLFYATLMSSGGADLPGEIMVEERGLGGAAFTVASSKPVAFIPQLESTPTANQTSTNSEFKNGLMYSKRGDPESVPGKNVFRVGSADDRIKRIVALQDALIIFKENDGIYILVGENEGSFSVRPLDLSAKVIAPDSLVPLNNAIYGLFDGGIATVTEAGIEYISDPIKDKLLYLLSNALPELKAYSFGIGYNIDGKYIIALPRAPGDTSATQQLIYDVYGESWVEWDLNIVAGGVNPVDELLYIAPGDSNKLKYERKSSTFVDFADLYAYRTIISANNTTLVLDDATDLEVGDILEQGNNIGYVEAIDYNSNTVTIDTAQSWTTGTGDVEHLKGIYAVVEWNAEFAENPAGQKLFQEGNLLFKQIFQKRASIHFFSDSNPAESSVPIEAPGGNGAWGEFDFGEVPFGGDATPQPVRFGIPRGHKRCNLLTVRFESKVAYSDFQLNGISLIFNPAGQRTTRGIG